MIKMKEKYKKMNGLKIRQKRKWVNIHNFCFKYEDTKIIKAST